MTHQEVRQRIEEMRMMAGPTAELAVMELLDAIEAGEVEGTISDLDLIRGEVVNFLLNEVPGLHRAGSEFEQYFSEDTPGTESTEVEARRMMEDLRVKMLEELTLWGENQLAIVRRDFVRQGSIWFAEGGFPAPTINAIRVRAQVADMRSWIGMQIHVLDQSLKELAYYHGPAKHDPSEFAVLIRSQLDATLDNWERILQYGTDAISSFQEGYKEQWMMVNWLNTVNQFITGKVFQTIGQAISAVMKGVIGSGKLGWTADRIREMKRLQRMVERLTEEVKFQPYKRFALQSYRVTLAQYERLTAANILRYGMPETGLFQLPARTGFTMAASPNQWAVNLSHLPSSTTGTGMAALGMFGAAGSLAGYESALRNAAAEQISNVIDTVFGAELQEKATEIAQLGGDEAAINEALERWFADHVAEVEFELEKAIGEVAPTIEMSEPPITIEAMTEVVDNLWHDRIDSLYVLLGRATDRGHALAVFEMLRTELSQAATPEQQTWAEGVLALAEELLSYVEDPYLIREEPVFDIGGKLPTPEEMEKM